MLIPIIYRLSLKKPGLLADIISSILLLLFLYTGLSKLSDYQLFKFVLFQSPWLKHFAGLIAWALPVTELIVALLLFIPAARLYGLYSSLILLSLFTLYLGLMLAFSPKVPCNCGGVIKSLTWPQHIGLNLFFILLSLWGIWIHRKLIMKLKPP